jgi:hypothetical protein
MYPAYPQSNQTFLELDVIPKDPLQKETYQEQDATQLSNYKNYVYQAQTSKHWKEAEFEGFALPAQGQSKPYCMKWVSWGCDNTKQHPNGKHYAEHENKTCKVANCPKCFESWINRQANRSTRRFSKYLEDKDFNFRHIILSPPQDQAKEMAYPQLKKWLSHALKVANIKTCAVVFHPFRFQDQKKSMPYVSPHFHLLVYGKITNTTKFYNKTQWLIKNKGDMKNEIDIFNCVRYMLSHAGIRERTHAVRYLGDISYRKLKVEKEPFEHNCPHCNLPLNIFYIKKSTKSRPPPIDLIGLWEPSCFSPVNYENVDTKIPFYSMNEDPKDETNYTEELIYSFEELLAIQIRSPTISNRKHELSLLIHQTSLNCQKIDSFC